jgi:uncharacterized membrane protein YesL
MMQTATLYIIKSNLFVVVVAVVVVAVVVVVSVPSHFEIPWEKNQKKFEKSILKQVVIC